MKILICSDASEQASNAVRFAATIAAGCRAETTILGITEKAGHEDAIFEALKNAQQLLREKQVNAEIIIKEGEPIEEIVKRQSNHVTVAENFSVSQPSPQEMQQGMPPGMMPPQDEPPASASPAAKGKPTPAKGKK